jgi:hypothetical protein
MGGHHIHAWLLGQARSTPRLSWACAIKFLFRAMKGTKS